MAVVMKTATRHELPIWFKHACTVFLSRRHGMSTLRVRAPLAKYEVCAAFCGKPNRPLQFRMPRCALDCRAARTVKTLSHKNIKRGNDATSYTRTATKERGAADTYTEWVQERRSTKKAKTNPVNVRGTLLKRNLLS